MLSNLGRRVSLNGWLVPYPPPPPPVQAPESPLDLPRFAPVFLGGDNAFLVTVTLVSIRDLSVPLTIRLIASNVPGAFPVTVAGPVTLSQVGESVTLDSGVIGYAFGQARFESAAGAYVFSGYLHTYRR